MFCSSFPIEDSRYRNKWAKQNENMKKKKAIQKRVKNHLIVANK